MGSAQRRANIFPIESAHLDEVRVECSSEERERRAKAAQAESVVKTLDTAQTRTNMMNRALKRVEALPETDAQRVLPGGEADTAGSADA